MKNLTTAESQSPEGVRCLSDNYPNIATIARLLSQSPEGVVTSPAEPLVFQTLYPSTLPQRTQNVSIPRRGRNAFFEGMGLSDA